jgi:hypothetical protein
MRRQAEQTNLSQLLSAKRSKSGPKLSLNVESPISDLQKIFNDENTDVTFVCRADPTDTVSAHKMVLSVACPYFHKMFQGDWKEKDQKELPIPGPRSGFRVEVFNAVISFLYGKNPVTFEEDCLVELYRASDYLELDSLKSAIGNGLSHWNLASAAVAVEMCMQDDHPDSCEEYIAKHIQDILKQHVDFTGLSFEIMLRISKSENVEVQEDVLHSFLCKWATAHKLSVENVKELFGNVRYSIIPVEILIKKVALCDYYHNSLFGRALNQFKSFCVFEASKHPLQYSLRHGQSYPDPLLFWQDGNSMVIAYNGNQDATLTVRNPACKSWYSCRITVSSTGNECKTHDIRPAETSTKYTDVVKSGIEGLQNSRLHIKLNRKKVTLFFDILNFPNASDQTSKTVWIQGSLPWFIKIPGTASCNTEICWM